MKHVGDIFVAVRNADKPIKKKKKKKHGKL